MPAIITHGLTKRFDTFTAVNSVNLSVKEGDLYALIGANGAGKTTLLKLLVGLLLPTAGTASIFGHDITRDPLAAKQHFGYVSDDPSAYDFLTGKEFLILTGRLRGMDGSALRDRIAELSDLFPIRDILSRPMTQYSRGNKQKVAFLASILTKPKLLIIDEPIVGLDSASIDIMGNALKTYTAEGNTVFIVTHILSFAQKYARQVGIMKEGKIIKEVPVTKTKSLDALL
jgi:ABC-2 type transport system ATP-binding protein